MFDFMENWGYNVGTRHFFGDKVSNGSCLRGYREAIKGLR